MSIEDILAQCLADLELGASVDECLARYPSFADELRPLLVAAQELRSVVPTRLSDEAFARGRRLLQEQMVQKFAEERKPPFLRKIKSIPVTTPPVIPIPLQQTLPPKSSYRSPYTFWVGIAASAAAVVVAAFLLSKLPELNIGNYTPPASKPVFLPVPTYTPTLAETLTIAPVVPTQLNSDLTETILPTETGSAESGQFVPIVATGTLVVESVLPINTATPLITIDPINTTVLPTWTTDSLPNNTVSPPINVTATAPSQPTLASTDTPSPNLSATATVSVVNSTTTPTSTLTLTATPSPIVATETATSLPDTETPTETATATATVFLTPIATAEIQTATPTQIGAVVDNTATPEDARATRVVIIPTQIDTTATLTVTLTPDP